MLRGSCCCGAVTFTVTGAPERAAICHCTECRKMSGYAWASAQVPEEGLEIAGPVRWISASPRARRGICPDCGAFLFWQGTGEATVSFALGAVDGPTGLRPARHIFTAEAGDYGPPDDGLPRDP